MIMNLDEFGELLVIESISFCLLNAKSIAKNNKKLKLN